MSGIRHQISLKGLPGMSPSPDQSAAHWSRAAVACLPLPWVGRERHHFQKDTCPACRDGPQSTRACTNCCTGSAKMAWTEVGVDTNSCRLCQMPAQQRVQQPVGRGNLQVARQTLKCMAAVAGETAGFFPGKARLSSSDVSSGCHQSGRYSRKEGEACNRPGRCRQKAAGATATVEPQTHPFNSIPFQSSPLQLSLSP